MPHMTASTARRSIVRRVNSSAEKVCEVACCANPTRANTAASALNIARLLCDQPILSADFESVTELRDRLAEEAARALQGQSGAFERHARNRNQDRKLDVVVSQSERLLSLLSRAARRLRHDTRGPA